MSTGSISLSGLLTGTAGSIDVTSLVSSLMSAASVPQSELQDQLTTVTSKLSAYQTINTQLTAVQTAATSLTSTDTWNATTATSSSSAVAATSTSSASAGSTTFDVTQLAASQVSTVTADSSGNVVTDYANGFTITGADGTAHSISLTSGSAAAVAKAVNSAGIGVRASVVTTDQGTVLQLSSSKTGTANAFTVSGLDSSATTVVAAANAKIAVGGSSGYTVSSSSNTFSNVIPGVSFSVGAVASGVTITVASDESSISTAVQALVTAANSARSTISTDTGLGAILQGSYDATSLATALTNSVSKGTSAGGSLSTYGIDVDKTGTITFDADTFATAYASDPTGTQTAIASAFAASLNTTATSAVDSTTGTITQAINGLTSTSTDLSTQISDWTTRLADIQTSLTTKYQTMQSALLKLQSQQSYLTSMFDSINGTSSSSSSSS